MKKLLFLSAAVIAAISFTSCEKEWTCKCTTTFEGAGSEAIVTETKFTAKKKDAKASCGDLEISMPGFYTMSCDLE